MGKELIEIRPLLMVNMDVEDLRNYYWLKEELTAFCKQLGIPATGKKLEILARIETVLRTGQLPQPEVAVPRGISGQPTRKPRHRDSDAPLTLDTPVVNFKSDQKTRQFFQNVIGPHFHFTAHMADFMREHKDETLTYGDLVEEWQAEHERRKSATYKPSIMKSCEYNQFIRDFFADDQNKGKRLKDAISAWNEVKCKHGERKYVRQQ